MPSIATITLTHNEEHNIERCLKSIQWADEKIIIDSFSTDETLIRAKNLATNIIQHEMIDFSTLRNFGINQVNSDWILMVDADEVIPDKLAQEIIRATKNDKFDGYYIRRINYMYGKAITFDQPDYQLRLFKKDKGCCRNIVHERIIVNGHVKKLRNYFLHYSMQNIEEHIEKLNFYTTLAIKGQKNNTIKSFLRPFYRLVHNFIFKKAHKDGLVGIIIALNAFFYEFITLFKVYEKNKLSKNWFDFYKQVNINNEIIQQSKVHKEFIDEILSSKEKVILEVGTGTAAILFFLAKANSSIKIITVDNNLDILKKAIESAKKLNLSIISICADAFKLPFKNNSLGSIFSQGLMEHFSNLEIKDLITEQLRICLNNVLFSVPNSYYKYRDLGNERLLSKNQWENILSGFKIITSKNYYKIRTKKNFLINHPVMYMCKIGKK